MEPVIYTLTKADVKALKTSPAVVFRTQDGANTIEAKLSEDNRHIIPVYVKSSVYGREMETYKYHVSEGFAMLMSCHYHETWMTIRDLLKAGDVLTLHWIAGGKTTNYLMNHHIVGDELQLIVERGKKKMHFVIENSVTPITNSARLCRKVEVRKEYA